MALQQRRESAGQPRFLLALSLSTVTALAVAAPLAIRAVNADDDNTFAVTDPTFEGTGEGITDEGLAASDERLLTPNSSAPKGGIGSRPPDAKALSQTTKGGTTEAGSGQPSLVDNSVLTNPPQTTTTAPASTTTFDPAASSSTSSTTDPTATTETTTSATTSSTDTTVSTTSTTTGASSSTSSSTLPTTTTIDTGTEVTEAPTTQP